MPRPSTIQLYYNRSHTFTLYCRWPGLKDVILKPITAGGDQFICYFRKRWLTFLRGRHSAESRASNLKMVLESSPGHLQYSYITAGTIHLLYTVDGGGWITAFWARYRPAAIICYYRKQWLTFLRSRHSAENRASKLQMVLKSSPGPLQYSYITAGAIQSHFTVDGGGWKTAVWARNGRRRLYVIIESVGWYVWEAVIQLKTDVANCKWF